MNGQPASKQYFPTGETLFQQQRRRGEVNCVNERAQQKRKYSGNERCIKVSSCKGKGVNGPLAKQSLSRKKTNFSQSCYRKSTNQHTGVSTGSGRGSPIRCQRLLA